MCLAIYRQDDFSVMDCVWYRKAASKWGMFTALELEFWQALFLLCLKFCVDFKFLVYFNLSMIEKELFSKNNVTFFVQ